jgi:crotonobetainyl-CoA:carnitine CoA-transferase CaiB-like acyl-CoA transferase
MTDAGDTPQRPRPLDGVRVLDLTRVLSGPHCTRMLCDLGAEVIKVEPPDGDSTRFANPRVNSMASYFVQQNAGKRNVSLDMSTPTGKELLLSMAEHCDVFVENFRPGVTDRMGIGYGAVSARNPTIVYASISGYGQTGPWVHRRAYAPVVGAEAGSTQLQGDARGGHYANDPMSHADVYTGMECASAILAALFQRERTGRGERIDVAMAQTMLYVNEHVHDLLWDGPLQPDWIRSYQPGDYPVLTAANGRTAIMAGHPAERGTFDRFVHAMGKPELFHDPRFADVVLRLQHFPELMEVMQAWASTMPDTDAIEHAMAEQGIATGTLRTVRDVCDTDWAEARQVTVRVSDRGGGTMRIPNAPWRFAGSEVGVRGEARYRGEDNHAVLRDLLGLDDERLQQLDAEGVLTSRVPVTP